ncbi:SurA N-terminal domain-containing protein [Pelagibacteraceae bacterium]|nr:SurA N-terminal domain-containing protein [Pelagibacteraceae bacterium]
MLDIVRNLVSSIFGKILLAVMVLSFALWGVGDILTSGNSQLAAKVGKEKITLDEFYNEFQNTVKNYNKISQSNLSLKEAYNIQLHSVLLNDLIYSKMINSYAKNNEIFINDESLKLIITDLPQFKNDDGQFSEVKYKSYILNNFPNEQLFLNQVENTIYQGMLFENFNLNSYLNESLVDTLYNYEGEKRSISYFLLKDNDVSINKSDELIREYYNENSENYTVKEKTIVDYIEINLENYKNLDIVNESQIINYYQNNIDQYSIEETRDIEFVRFENEIDAQNFYNLYSTNDDEKISEFINKSEIKINKINEFNGDSFPESLKESIFSLPLLEVSPPLKYEELGYYIFKINSINDAQTAEIDDVKDEIKNYLASEDAYLEFDETINIADEMLINDYSFEDISEGLQNINIKKSIDLEDLLTKFDNENNVRFKDKPTGYISEIIMNQNKAFIFTIKVREKAYIPDLEQVLSMVTNDYENNEIIIKQHSIADKILIELQFKDFDNFQNYSKKNSFDLKTNENIGRDNIELTNNTVINIFELNADNVFKVELENGQVGIGYLNKIIKPDDYISDNFYQSVKNNIQTNYNNSLQSIIGNEIINNTSYEIFSQNIDKLFM